MSGLPLGWFAARLADISDVIDPNPTHRNPKYLPQGFPFVSTAEFVEPDGVLTETRRRVAESTVLEQENRCRFGSRSILFSRKGTIGKARMLPPVRLALLDSLCVINPVESVDARFLLQALRSPQLQARIEAAVRGVALRQVSVGAVRQLVVPIPPSSEQRRIVAKLDALLERHRRTQDLLDAATNELDCYRRTVLSSLSREERGQSSEWKRVRIGDVVECLDRLRRPVNKDERTGRAGEIPYYGANGPVGWIDEHIFDEELVLVVEDETFVGRTKPFSYKISGKAWVNNHVHVLRPSSAVLVDFLNYSLAHYPFIPLTSGTTGRRKLTQQALLAAPYLLPPLHEQLAMVRRVEALLAKADDVEKQLKEAQARRKMLEQSILAKAFRGELVPQDPRDEPASVLLERIRAERAADPEKGIGKHRRSSKRKEAVG